MSDPNEIPAFADLAADPEIAPLLDFTPVPRQIKRPNGWTPELQRELIARIALTGTVQQAVWQMGKHATGAEYLYKNANADSFRASWDAAIAIGRRRNGLDSRPPFAGPVPGITRRSPRGSLPPSTDPAANGEDNELSMDEDEQLGLLERLAAKFLRKVVQEREARLAGEIAAADFYLRQITCLEVGFDLLAEGRDMEAMDALHELRRGGHPLHRIADTPFSQYLDLKRREYWASEGGPMRPPNLREEWLVDHGDHRTDPGDSASGPASTPARGHSLEQWQALTEAEREGLRRAQRQSDAEAQLEWERHAHQAWRESAEGKAADTEGGAGFGRETRSGGRPPPRP